MSDRIHAVAVVVNGTIRDAIWTKERIMDCDYVIGVDGGNNYLHRMNIVPDLIIGDLDSIAEETRKFFTDRGCSFMTFLQPKINPICSCPWNMPHHFTRIESIFGGLWESGSITPTAMSCS